MSDSLRKVGIFLYLIFLLVVSHAYAGEFVTASWITRWAFKERKDVKTIMQDLKSSGVDIVFFQVRGSCDALYKSNYEPWCEFLTGSLGKNPGWDPLAEAIAQGKRLGIEVHAWINLLPAWPVSPGGLPPSESKPRHILLDKPEWVACDRWGKPMSLKYGENSDNYVFLSPTNPEVREYLLTVIEDLVSRYEIKGIHFDYARFPDSTYSYDQASLTDFEKSNAESMTFTEWRRVKLTELIGEASYTARLSRPGIKVSAAVVGDLDRARDYYLQDGVDWVRRGYVDFIVPMIYTGDIAEFKKKALRYLEELPTEKLILGIGAYLNGFDEKTLSQQIEVAKTQGVLGISVFNSDYVPRYRSVLKAN